MSHNMVRLYTDTFDRAAKINLRNYTDDLEDNLPPPPPYSSTFTPANPMPTSAYVYPSFPSAPPAKSVTGLPEPEPYLGHYGTMGPPGHDQSPRNHASPPTNPNLSPPQSPSYHHPTAPPDDSSSSKLPFYHPKRWIPHMHDDEDGEQSISKNRPLKYALLALVIWFVIFKMLDSDSTGEDYNGGNGKGGIGGVICREDGRHDTYTWDQLPEPIQFTRGLSLGVRGSIMRGKVQIRPTVDQAGSIRAVIKVYKGADVQYNLARGTDTRLDLDIAKDGCAVVDVEVELPVSGLKNLALNLSNIEINAQDLLKVDTLHFVTSNSNIEFNGWKGIQTLMQTTNARIQSSHDLAGHDTIQLQSSNGPILLPAILGPPKSVHIKTTNGAISSDCIEATDSAQISTTNANVHIQQTKAPDVRVLSSNGGLRLPLVETGAALYAHTTNEAVTMTVLGNRHAHVDVSTSNAPLELQMLNNFEGDFSVKTSSHERVMIMDTSDTINLRVNKPHEKEGSRNQGHDGRLSAKTSNSNIRVTFIN
ncbi:hypothetical protein EC973_005951 [Apophysomyces ossiformis]|uniref:DUF4097 domain-containing protein n=1 Tax=Apophysomyces ossiformis TaxID=679940 RepID=A0A8H7ERB7_9FUNG|nr:hypothetical protein EC973_005951 [Apophysomyces ossiformis]